MRTWVVRAYSVLLLAASAAVAAPGSPTQTSSTKTLNLIFPTLSTATLNTFKSSTSILDDAAYKFLYNSCGTYSNPAACDGKISFGIVPRGTPLIQDSQLAVNRMTVLSPNGTKNIVDVTIDNGTIAVPAGAIADNQIGLVRVGYYYGSSKAPLASCTSKVYFCGSGVAGCPQDSPSPTCFPLLGKSSAAGCVPLPGTACADLKPTFCPGETYFDSCGTNCGAIGSKVTGCANACAKITTNSVINPSASGLSNGAIALTASGGSGSFSYSISPAIGSKSAVGGKEVFSNLPGAASPGATYTVTVVDTTDPTCNAKADYVLIDPTACSLAFSTLTVAPTIPGKPNGNITASYTGAVGAVNASISPNVGSIATSPGAFTFNSLSAPAGGTSYTVTLTDTVCKQTADVNLSPLPGGELCITNGPGYPAMAPFPTLPMCGSGCQYGFDNSNTAVVCSGSSPSSYGVNLSRCKLSDGVTTPALDCGANKTTYCSTCNYL